MSLRNTLSEISHKVRREGYVDRIITGVKGKPFLVPL